MTAVRDRSDVTHRAAHPPPPVDRCAGIFQKYAGLSGLFQMMKEVEKQREDSADEQGEED